MYIRKINISNFKCYKHKFSLDLSNNVNILVGNNEAGKSTILEAIHLALTGMLNGHYIRNELSQYLFNREIERDYIDSLNSETRKTPPFILIELFIGGEACQALSLLKGNCNSDHIDDCGVSFIIEFDEQYQSEYEELIKTAKIKTVPIEYYKITWRSFARTSVTAKSIPIKSAMINSSGLRVQNGSDIYISSIIREVLDDKERVEISQAHRKMKETFMDEPSVVAINQKITAGADVTNKNIEISVDLSTQHAWESSLMTYFDGIPFHYIGKGEQSFVKTNLALSHKKTQESNIILLEEPENHLSHSKMNELINKISSNVKNKQVIIATHSSFVANKLGLEKLIFLNDSKNIRLNGLSDSTKEFFSKLSGYDTLRVVLCKKAILVEGDSDELIVQKAYFVKYGKLPIEDGIDVISVGTSFLRFLEIADKIDKNIVVVTDNDGNVNALKKKYAQYFGNRNVKICFDEDVNNGTTLEPQILNANSLEEMNLIFGTSYKENKEMEDYMKNNNNKVDCALKIFDSDNILRFPQYIEDAIS